MDFESRKIKPLDQHGCPMSYRPPDSVDSSDPGNNVGNIDPFSDDPISDADPITNEHDSGRPGFTSRWYSTPNSESSEVRRARMSQTPNPPKNFDAPERRHEGGQSMRKVGRSGDWGGGLERGGPGGMRSTLRDS
jgi:hypothetical protein